MKILISNDDGIASRGINVLTKAMKEIGDVLVVAPTMEQSAVGHAITMKIPVRVREYYNNGKFFGYSVDGTPADCVKMGIKNILKKAPDIVISGINNGSNAAINTIYSGTVSAAREAAIMNVPAIAVSITDPKPADFSYAAEVSKKLVEIVCKNKLRRGTLLNVNIPNMPKEEIKGFRLTRQGFSRWDDIYEERTDPYGGKYYWLTGVLDKDGEVEDSDTTAIENNYIAITPIQFDLTDYDMLDKMQNWNFEKL